MRFFLKLITIISFLVLSLTTYAQSTQYKIFVDAGSTGSRVHLFQYKIENNQPIPVIEDIFSASNKLGLSTFAEHPEAAGASLKAALDDAKLRLQKEGVNLHDVSVNILATAGMRLLTEEKQQEIYTHITNYLKQNYEFTIGDIKTIPGKMEGFYGWLDVNYLSGNFQNHLPTVGSIDMGGASTQLVFATTDTSKPEDIISFTIANQHYTVFSKSFLGLGQDQARDTMTLESLASSCYPLDFAYGKDTLGNFNMKNCDTIYADLINKKQVAQQIIPTQGQSFVAYSGIYFTYNFLGTDQATDKASVEKRIHDVCEGDAQDPITWDKLKKNYPQVAEKYLSGYCANGVYQDHLLYDTYKIQGQQLTVTNKINNRDIDWSLGAALYSLIERK